MMVQNFTQVRERVIERLADITVVQSARIDEATEIYQDLRVSGWDLWDFLGWVCAEFGTDFSAMNISKYSPGEGAQLFAGTYRSLTVGAVLNAISRGSWTETG